MFLVRNKCINYNKYVKLAKINKNQFSTRILLKNEITNKNLTSKRAICSTNVIWNTQSIADDIYQSDYLPGKTILKAIKKKHNLKFNFS